MNGSPILVVDDDLSLRRVMKLELEEAGHPVMLAASAEEALHSIAERRPRLVITDLRMPGAGGLDLLRTLREQHDDITVIIITAFGAVESAVEAMKAGAYDYLTKPIDYEALSLVIRRAPRAPEPH